ncbi:unnamed protein product [Polarella glacialis]|uniref:Uncharacterized protein n=1 Tax=Polarella glacialis TaxID=89957 RepID=A0A813DGU1_POLGL|nr:unnamed protein product [Polarella glacialis]
MAGSSGMALGKMDCNKNPWNAMKIFQEATRKEEMAKENSELKAGGPQRFRFQAPGEEVELRLCRSQPHLNGVRGLIDFTNTDENGYLKVRMPKWARTTRAGSRAKLGADSGLEGSRYLKIRPQNLVHVRQCSDSRPRGGILKEFLGIGDDEVSVKSCTDTNASCSRLGTGCSRLSTGLRSNASLPLLPRLSSSPALSLRPSSSVSGFRRGAY